MTNSFIASIKKNDKLMDNQGQIWTATADAKVPDRDTVNAEVWLKRTASNGTRWSLKLTHNKAVGWCLVGRRRSVRIVK